MDANTAAILSSFIGVVGNLLAVGLGIGLGVRLLEKQELRKQQVECIVTLYGALFVMSNEFLWSSEDKSVFNHAINKIGVLYSTHSDVRNALVQFRKSRENGDFAALIHAMCKAVGVKAEAINREAVENILMLANKTPPASIA
jgi:hypothetical protein